MISSEANVKKIVALIEDSKGWVELKSEKTRLDVTHKLCHYNRNVILYYSITADFNACSCVSFFCCRLFS